MWAAKLLAIVASGLSILFYNLRQEEVKTGKWIVKGGIHSDFSFAEIAVPVEYGPFDTWDEAYNEWKARSWFNMDDQRMNVDNALYRLYVTEI
jgi:hypothetical protein